MAVRRAPVAILLLLLTACSGPSPSPSTAASTGASTSPPSTATGTSDAPATPTATPSPVIPPPATARPYTAAEVLAAMRDSRRPGGVPDEIETIAVATQLAAAIWTYDGRAYPSLVISGSCGPASCTVEVNGTPAGAAGTDLYVMGVARPSGTVELQAADLHGYPSGLDATIDAVVRARLDAQQLDGLALAGATWQVPPRAGWFWAAYRSGGEEGSPGLDVLVNLPTGEVAETREP